MAGEGERGEGAQGNSPLLGGDTFFGQRLTSLVSADGLFFVNVAETITLTERSARLENDLEVLREQDSNSQLRQVPATTDL